MRTKTSTWITIPEESSEKQNPIQIKKEEVKKNTTEKINSSESVLKMEETLNNAEEVIKHKWFWATGFVAVMIFTALLLAPDQFSALLKGNLFDNYDGVEVLPPFPGSEADLAEQAAEALPQEAIQTPIENNNNQVVEPENEAVNVQVDPVMVQVDPVTTEPVSSGENTVSSPPSTEAPTPIPSSELTDEAASLAAQQALIEKLNQELQAFQQESDNQVQQLNGNPELGSPLFPAAENNSQQPVITATPLNQNNAIQTTNNALNTAQATTTYRLNPYRVAMTPQQVLAQNQAKVAAGTMAVANTSATASYASQANIAAANAQLNQIQNTPESGPMTLMWGALMVGVLLAWGMLRKKASL